LRPGIKTWSLYAYTEPLTGCAAAFLIVNHLVEEQLCLPSAFPRTFVMPFGIDVALRKRSNVAGTLFTLGFIEKQFGLL
jgi:hypothetical protein